MQPYAFVNLLDSRLRENDDNVGMMAVLQKPSPLMLKGEGYAQGFYARMTIMSE